MFPGLLGCRSEATRYAAWRSGGSSPINRLMPCRNRSEMQQAGFTA
jgi:hypothetical protein